MDVNDYSVRVLHAVRSRLEELGVPVDEARIEVGPDPFSPQQISVAINCPRTGCGNRWSMSFGLDAPARNRQARRIANDALVELWSPAEIERFKRRAAERMATTDAPGALPKEVLDGADLEMTNQAVASPDLDPGRIIFRQPGQKVEANSDHGFQIAPQYSFSAEPQHGFAYRPVAVKDGRIVEGQGCVGCELVREVEQAVAERDELAKLASDRQAELSRLRDELAAAHERDSQNAAHISRLCRQMVDIERRVAGGEAGPSAVAQAPGYERGPRIVAQSQYDPDE